MSLSSESRIGADFTDFADFLVFCVRNAFRRVLGFTIPFIYAVFLPKEDHV